MKREVKIKTGVNDLDEYKIRAVEWIWPYRIARGTFTLVAGRPGTGKSTLLHNVAARMSTGMPWPDRPDTKQAPGSTLLITEEDSIEAVVRPRMHVMRADPKRIKVWDHLLINDVKVRFNLRDHLELLEQFLMMVPDVRLVILDTIESFMGKSDTHRNSDVRQVLDPLITMASRLNIGIVGITHLNKASKENKSAIDRIMGSVGYTGAARQVWLLAKDDEDEQGLIKMVQVKSNICKNPGGIAYKIQSVHTEDFMGRDVETTVVTYRDGIVREDADVLSQLDSQVKKKEDTVGHWLVDLLKHGPVLQESILKMAKEEGFAQMTVYRRRDKLGIQTLKTTSSSGAHLTWWKIPENEKK